ncbi:MAG: hypothetical protein QXY84_04495 [Candidatus Caldarchaeum sp.]
MVGHRGMACLLFCSLDVAKKIVAQAKHLTETTMQMTFTCYIGTFSDIDKSASK